MSEQESFHEAMRRDPSDHVSRLVYADWLEENGNLTAAERLRWWGNMIPHLNETSRHTVSGAQATTLLPPWVRTLVTQHHWRDNHRGVPEDGSSHGAAVNRMWPHSELQALGITADPAPEHPANIFYDVGRFTGSGDEAPTIDQSNTHASRMHTAIEYSREHSPTKLSRVRLAAIEPPGKTGGSVLVRVPTPTPAPASPKSKPAPAQPKRTSSGPAFLLPQ